MAVLGRFQDPSYVNWLKAGQALLCTAEGIRDFCEGPIKQYHQYLHNKFPWKHCKANCGVNNKLCGVCTKRRGDWKKEIPSQLITPSPPMLPCWKNVRMDMLETNFWETAKVFMTPGQDTRTGPSDTDPIGLLQLVLNCKLFSSCVSRMESFEDVREIRNKLFHSADFKLSHTQLDDYIKDMTRLLQDPKQLLTDPNAVWAVIQLNKIKTLPLETNSTQVLQAEQNELKLKIIDTERDMWKTKIDEMKSNQSVTETEVKNAVNFISKQDDLNKIFKGGIKSLTERVDELETNLKDTKADVSKLQTTQQQQDQEISQLKNTQQQHSTDMSELCENQKQMRDEQRESVSELQKKQQQQSKSMTELKETQQQMEKKQQQQSEGMSELHAKHQQQSESLSELREKQQQMQDKQSESVSELQKAQQQQSESVCELKKTQQQHSEGLSELREDHQQLNQTLSHLHEKHQHQGETVSQLDAKFEDGMADLDRRLTKVEEVVFGPKRIEEELERLVEQLTGANERKMEKFLKDTKFFKNIEVDQFSDMYIEPIVHENGDYKRLYVRSNINCLSCQMDVGQCKPVKVEELILPDPESDSGQKVLVTGSAGAGKSMLSMYLLDMWLEGKLPAFENVFFYSMRELSRVEKCSLGDLLFMHQYVYRRPSDDIAVEYVQRMSKKTLVVFDGLDAFDSYSLEPGTFDCNEEVEMSRLIGSIIGGHTLKLVTLLVTSRPGGVSEYKKFDQVAEIYGFNETMVDKYVEMYCQGEVTLNYHINNFINSNVNVSSLCHLPVFCYVLCEMGKIGLERDTKAPFPTTMTRLIVRCVDNFVREQHPNFSGKELGRRDVVAEVREQLIAHSKLAAEGMSHQPVKVVFSYDDVKDVFSNKDVKVLSSNEDVKVHSSNEDVKVLPSNEDVKGVSSNKDVKVVPSNEDVKAVFVSEDVKLSHKIPTQCGFVNVATERKQVVMHTKITQSYFVHLVMQEFFAAIALVSSLEDIEKLLDETPNEGQLDMVLTFIAGLVGDPDNKTFLESLGYNATTKMANPIHRKVLVEKGYNLVITASELLELVVIHCDINEHEHERRRRRNHKASILLLLRLLYESRDPYLWSEVKAFVLRHQAELDLSGTEITSADLQALTYVAHKTSDISCVDLRGCDMFGDCGAALAKLSQLTQIRL